ncbi:STAS domain-containing protein [Streptacidiphilus sp. P02-A3a]|uniref:STAS domain-containing protein n=1 Tax=Streptacidiphilus sp. P02-A3a TaxID=2704468 RepID=UPI0015F7FFB8|nr:STAS domain-containing protein [Streptacidiphilus sp. P02-A3a]QMU70688.1 STAS domain-containing protein [Streptacidiphilus sp. P02-A3a]
MDADPALAVVVLEHGSVAEVLLAGELDVEAAPRLRVAVTQILIDPQVRRIDVDVSLVNFCDSSGLTALIRARVQARGFGVPLCLVRVGPRLRRLLRLTGLWDVLDCTGVEDVP